VRTIQRIANSVSVPLRAGMRKANVLAALAAAVIVVLNTAGPGTAAATSTTTAPSGLHVSGNGIVDGTGRTVVLHGVDRSGTEYACIQGWGIFDGPSDAASVAAIASWHVNAVRVPLNEDCWLGINGTPAAYSGATYRKAISDYVALLHSYGLAAVLDLHWTAAGSAQATGQTPMADADHAPTFWTSVASTFKDDSSTLFDLYNEPRDISWTCWRDGGPNCGTGYTVAGMQTLLDAVRAAGATNIVLAGGNDWGGDLSRWNAFKPADPTGNLAASWHNYNFSGCNTASCWNSTVAPVAAASPLVTGELGENDCGHGYIDAVMAWLDSYGGSYLGWAWNTQNCGSFPGLIASYDGTPTAFGVGFRDHLAALAGNPTPAPAPTPTPTPTTPAPTPTPTPTTPAPAPTPTPTTPAPRPTTSAPAAAGPAATTSANVSSAPWWWEEDLAVTPAAPISALTVTITVARTAGLAASGQYQSGPGAATVTSTASQLVYRYQLAGGQTLRGGSPVTFAAQFSGTGTAHPISGDTWTVTATSGDMTTTRSGRF